MLIAQTAIPLAEASPTKWQPQSRDREYTRKKIRRAR
jgi:hypothetical protein